MINHTRIMPRLTKQSSRHQVEVASDLLSTTHRLNNMEGRLNRGRTTILMMAREVEKAVTEVVEAIVVVDRSQTHFKINSSNLSHINKAFLIGNSNKRNRMFK